MLKKITLLFFIAGISNVFSQNNLNFIDKADMITARSGSAAVTDGTYQYIVNGFSATQPYTSEIERYNYNNNSWSVFSTNLPIVATRFGNAEIVNGKLYIFNGKTDVNINNNLVEIVDLATGNVTYGATNPFPVSSAGSAVNGNDIYFFGGNVTNNNAVYSKSLYKYNTVTNQWTQLTDMDKPLEIAGKIINNKLYTFGGYSELNNYTENFETVATTGNLVLTDWINIAESGTKLYQGKSFTGNKYAQVTAFDSNTATQEASNISWLISPEYYKSSTTTMSDTYLNYETKDGYNNGATLQAYIITNWTGDITTSTKTLLPGTIAGGSTSGYATDFTKSGSITLADFSNTFRIAFKYTGGYSPLATTTYQIDNVRIYTDYRSPYIDSYDIITDTWGETNTEMPQPVSANALAVNGDKIFVCGDYYEQSFLGIYNTTDDNFTSLTSIDLKERRHHNAEVHNNSLYLFGGNKAISASTVTNSTQSADIATLNSNEIISNSELKTYPNPVSDILYFNDEMEKISIFTIEGKKLEVQSLNSGINVTSLNNGVYLIVAESKNGKTYKSKFVKK